MKRIRLKHGTARVDEKIDKETIESLNRMAEKAYEANEVCDYCGGTGWDSYPNHETTMRPCPKCQP